MKSTYEIGTVKSTHHQIDTVKSTYYETDTVSLANVSYQYTVKQIPEIDKLANCSDSVTDGDMGKSVLKTTWSVITSPVGLLIILVGYTFAGGAIFQELEGKHEEVQKQQIMNLREDIIADMWNNSARRSMNEKMFAKAMKDELKKYEVQLHSAFAQGVNSDSEDETWDYWGSLIYSTTIYTTVGYGHIAPATDKGRVATMIYAVFGIPLCLIFLAECGKLLTVLIKFVLSFPRRLFYTGKCTKPTGKTSNEDYGVDEPDVYVIDEDFNLSPILAIIIGVAYMFGGAYMYTQWEDWDYPEAFYFIFISLSTIGFGDVLPENPRYFLMSFMYQLFGLALIAMVINVIMESMNSTIEAAKASVGNVVGLGSRNVASEKKRN